MLQSKRNRLMAAGTTTCFVLILLLAATTVAATAAIAVAADDVQSSDAIDAAADVPAVVASESSSTAGCLQAAPPLQLQQAASLAPLSLAPAPLLTLLWLLKALGYVLLLVLLAVWWLQGSLLYMADFGRRPGEGGDKIISSNPRGFRSPAEYGMRHEEVWLRSGSGGTKGEGVPLHAWLILQPGAAASRAPTMLFFHGNAGNIGYRLPNLRALVHACGCNVLIVDYRGYGNSAGEPSEHGLLEDAQAALDFLRSRGGVGANDGAHAAPATAAVGSDGVAAAAIAPVAIDPTQIHLFGRSLGGAVALQLAASDSEARQKQLDRHQRPPPPLAGVIIENSFSTLRDMVFVLATRMGLLRPPTGTASPEQAETNANAAAQAQEENMERRQQRQRQQRDAEASPQSPLSAAAEEDDDEEDDDEAATSEIVPVPAALPVGAGGPGGDAANASIAGSGAGGEGLLRRMLRFVLHLLMTSRWDSVSAVRRMDPSLALLFISGLMDELVPAAHMAQLHAEAMAMHEAHAAAIGTHHAAAANVAPIAALRTLHTVERGGHNDTHARGGLLYFHTIARFFHDAHHRAQELQRRQQAASFAAAINAAEAL